jgi:hypothetical protein
VAPANRPFSPQYPLWTDGATKRRWIYLPEGTTIDARNIRRWEFPVGTRFWKEFSFAGRPVETRLLWKTSSNRWVAGSYVWNEGRTDAVLTEDGVIGAAEIAPGRQHNVPSRSDCAACHGTAGGPLGFNPLQLSNDRDPNAIHGEPLTRDMITLQTRRHGSMPAIRRRGQSSGTCPATAARAITATGRSPRKCRPSITRISWTERRLSRSE